MEKQFFNRILDVRNQKKLTQRQLADLAEIAPGSLSAYEKGQKTPPVDAAARIAKALGVSLDWLFGYEVDMAGTTPKSYGDIIKALLPLSVLSIPMEMGAEWHSDKHDTIISRIAIIRMTDDVLATFFDSWAKLFKLYQAGDVDEEMYCSWLDKRIEALSVQPLPLPQGG